jgi:hypothetical protein
MLSDEQKSHLSAIAKGRSRDSKGRLLPVTSCAEVKIAELEAQVGELEAQLKAVNHWRTEEAQEKQIAEGRYVALHRRRSIEWGILITSIVGGIVMAGLFALVNGGAK